MYQYLGSHYPNPGFKISNFIVTINLLNKKYSLQYHLTWPESNSNRKREPFGLPFDYLTWLDPTRIELNQKEIIHWHTTDLQKFPTPIKKISGSVTGCHRVSLYSKICLRHQEISPLYCVCGCLKYYYCLYQVL